MQDPDTPPEAEGRIAGDGDVVLPIMAANRAATGNNKAAFTPRPWITAIGLEITTMDGAAACGQASHPPTTR